jgi:hypothetical protein
VGLLNALYNQNPLKWLDLRMQSLKFSFFIFFFSVFFTGYSQCIEGNCVDGFGTFKCSCGYIFEGEFKDGKKVYGTLTKENLIYTGEFTDDVAEGQGVIKFIDSTWYEGSFINNFPEGYGTFHFADGVTYTGEMFEGKFKGVGVLKYAPDSNGFINYKLGIFENDALNGFGINMYSDGSYFGQFENGEPNGFGVFLVDSGVILGGKIKNAKVSKQFDLEKDTELINFGSRPMKISKDLFWVEGKFDGSELVIAGENKEVKNLRVYFIRETNELFLSSFESYPKGKIIDLNGIITEAEMKFEGGKIQIIKLNNEHN